MYSWSSVSIITRFVLPNVEPILDTSLLSNLGTHEYLGLVLYF